MADEDRKEPGAFTSNRALHSLGVSRLMYRLAPDIGLSSWEMSLLGWIHDFGYMLGDPDAHAGIMGNLLSSRGCFLAGAVARHGDPKLIDWSRPEDILLNGCDMSVAGDGHLVSFSERLSDVANRWGEQSSRVLMCREVCFRLEKSAVWQRVAPKIDDMLGSAPRVESWEI